MSENTQSPAFGQSGNSAPRGKIGRPRKPRPHNFVVEQIDPQVWSAFKARARVEGHSLKWLFNDFARRYASGGGP